MKIRKRFAAYILPALFLCIISDFARAQDCTDPAAAVGAMVFNNDDDVFQGCTKRGWYPFHELNSDGGGTTNCPNVGDLCADGSYYIGDIGAGKVYAAAEDEGSLTWGSYGTTRGTTSSTDGEGNTNTLAAFGQAAHPAAYACWDKSAHFNNDWYLPARNELDLFWNGGAPVAGINTSGTNYWTSTEGTDVQSWNQRFSDGDQWYNSKTNTFLIRCVRRD